MGSSDQFHIRWNNYSSVLQTMLCSSLESEQFVDVTLACEGQSIKCHRLILSACSTYFERILKDNSDSNLVIYLTDMKVWQLRALVTFMYTGEVSISQQRLHRLCKAAEALKVKGLAHDEEAGPTDEEMDNMEEEEGLEDFIFGAVGKESQTPRENHPNSEDNGQSKSLDLNNLPAFAAAVAEASRPQTQQLKRKMLTQPTKLLVKMQRVEGPSNGTVGGNDGGSLRPEQVPVSTANKANKSTPKETSVEEEDDIAAGQDTSPSSSINEDAEVIGYFENNAKIDGGDKQATMGPPVDSADRAERLKKATALALSGIAKRQAAAKFEIPRTTLCAYMKRHGLSPKRHFHPINSIKRMQGNSDMNAAETVGQGGGGNATHYENFPFLGVLGLMDEIGHGSYDAEGYAEAEEEYSGK